ncbi:MAG: aldo/keto reductase [Dehalococcoidales bacterium]
MKYRKFGKLEWEVSALGFGGMRFPILNNNFGNVNEPEAIRMMRYAFDQGVNYVDSAWGYHHGNSEVVIGKALQDGYRKKVRIATKLPCFEVKSYEDFDRLLDEQAKRLQTEKIDFYLLHGLNRREWPKVRDLGVIKWAESAIADGRIGYLGFSFHDDYEIFQEIVDAYDNWTLCQFQYNYMDEEFQAGTRGLHYAHRKGLAVVVMEPLRAGRLARPPEKVAKVWANAPAHGTPQEWGLRWVWNHPEVTVVLSGMSTMGQVIENVAYTEHSQPSNLTADELALIERVREAYFSLNQVSCTACRYCMPCPNGVDIPRMFFASRNSPLLQNIFPSTGGEN